MNVTNSFTSMEQIRHRMQTTDSQRQVKKQTVQTQIRHRLMKSYFPNMRQSD